MVFRATRESSSKSSRSRSLDAVPTAFIDGSADPWPSWQPLIRLLLSSLLLLTCSSPSRESTSPRTPALPLAPAAAPPDAQLEIVHLAPGDRLQRKLAGGDTHLYEVELKKDDFLHLEILQEGIDVIVDLFDPTGQPLADFDNFTGAFGPEDVAWCAESSGNYRLQLRAFGKPDHKGTYLLSFQETHPATEQDRLLALSILAARKGSHLLKKGTPQAIDLAIQAYRESLSGWEEIGDKNEQGEALLQLAYIYRELKQDELANALTFYSRASALFDQTENYRRRGSALTGLGRTLRALGRTEESISTFELALEHRKKSGDKNGEVATSNDLGLLFDSLGESDRALEYYDRALACAQSMGNEELQAIALYNRANFYSRMGKSQQSTDDLNKSLKIREKLGDQEGITLVLSALGLIYRERGDPDSIQLALKHFQNSLSMSLKVGSLRRQGVALNDIGLAYEQTKLYDTALDHLQRALELFQQLDLRYPSIITLNNLGRVSRKAGQFKESEHYLNEALALLSETATPQLEVQTRYHLAYTQFSLGNIDSAIDQAEQAISLVEALRLKPTGHETRSLFFASHQNCYELLVDLLMEKHLQFPALGLDAQAFNIAERARARALLESMEINPPASLQPATPEQHRLIEIEREINSKEFQRLRFLENGASLKQLESLELDTRELLREHELLLGYSQNNSLHESIAHPKILDARHVQEELLDSDSLLLEYRLGETRSFVWAITKEQLSSYPLPGRKDIDSISKAAYKLIASGNNRRNIAPTRLTTRRIANLLLEPVSSDLGKKKIFIVQDSALYYVPFAALPDPTSSRIEPLLANHEITSIPSASTLASLRSRRRRPAAKSKLLAVVADPVFQPYDPRVSEEFAVAESRSSPTRELDRYERLVYSKQEADAILKLVDPKRSLGIFDFDAAGSVLKNGELSNYQYIHIATHVELDSQRPMLSRLIFSLIDRDGHPQDGFLHAHEIYNLNFSADLVALSACHSALGQEIRGEGFVGLAHAFLNSGASRVLVSLWQVDDRATVNLMAGFYRYLLVSELTPSDALRRAQLDLMRDKTWQNPYYWAGFLIMGED